MTNTPAPTYHQEASHPPFRRPHRALTGADVKALRPLRGRAPRPSLDSDAYLSANQHRAEKIKNRLGPPLTGPSPSGMTCVFDLFHVIVDSAVPLTLSPRPSPDLGPIVDGTHHRPTALPKLGGPTRGSAR
jgi:hypothetical protein